MSFSIHSNIRHARFRPYQVTIGWREIKNFAAALHDTNPLYFDDERPDGILAPPTFPVAVTWPIVEHLNDHLLGATLPENLLSTMVHFDESLRLHQPVRPGMHLSIQTDVAAVLPHKNGSRLFLRFRAVDQDNRSVFSEVTGALLRGVVCEGACGSAEDLPVTPAFPENQTPLWERNLTVDPLFPYIYDGCTNIVFPIHTSKAFAHRVGLPDVLVQGTATLGLVMREIVNAQAERDPRRIKEIHAHFSGMVLPGATIRIQLFEDHQKENTQKFYFLVLNEQKQPLIKNGFVKIAEIDE